MAIIMYLLPALVFANTALGEMDFSSSLSFFIYEPRLHLSLNYVRYYVPLVSH